MDSIWDYFMYIFTGMMIFYFLVGFVPDEWTDSPSLDGKGKEQLTTTGKNLNRSVIPNEQDDAPSKDTYVFDDRPEERSRQHFGDF